LALQQFQENTKYRKPGQPRPYSTPNGQIIHLTDQQFAVYPGKEDLQVAPKPTSQPSRVKEYEYARENGFTGSFPEFLIMQAAAEGGHIYAPPQASGGQDPVNRTGGASVQAPGGPVPTDPTTATGTLVPLVGSDAAREAAKAETKQQGRRKQTARAGTTVLQDLGRAINIVKNDWGSSGAPAIVMRQIPGTDAFVAHGHIESALSNIGLDTLQTMRENSPTGGALGQVPIQQQKRLEQVLGSLDQAAPQEVVLENLERVHNIYMDIVYGTPDEIQELVNKGEISAAEAQPLMRRHSLPFDAFGFVPRTPKAIAEKVSQEEWYNMTDEERAVWQ